MHNQSLRTVRISLALMTLASYMALATTESFGPEITLVPLVLVGLMPVFERIDMRTPMYRRVTHIITLAFTIVIIPALFRNLIVALTAIIFYIQVYLFLHGKSVRDYRYLFLMAFFLLVDAVAQSPDPAFGLVMPLFILSAVWAFASVQIYAETIANANGNIADLLPQIQRRGFLPPEIAQWMSGDKRDKANVAPVLAVLSLGCVFATLLFFMFTPRMEAGVFGRSNVLNQPLRSGLDDGVNLSRGGTIAADEAPVFLARFPKEPNGKPGMDEIYWRVTSYNELVGSDWSRKPGELEFHEWRRMEQGVLERESALGGRQIVQEIFLESTTDRVGIPAMPRLVRLEPPETTRFQPDDWDPFTIRIFRSSSQSFSYVAISEPEERTEAELRAAPGNYDDQFRRNRSIALYTSHRLSERAKTLARNLTANVTSPYEKARAIETHLKDQNEYLYTTRLAELPEDDPIDAFLFVRKTGHCELYASTMCMLVRSLGIPARVASGYKIVDAFDWSQDDNAYIVRKRHAHLWVEVYLNEIGWYRFDPSGTVPMDDSLMARTQRSLSRYLLNMKVMYYRDVVGFSSGIQLGNLVSFSIGLFRFDFDVMRDAIPSFEYFARGLPRAMLIIFLTVTVFWGMYVMYRSAVIKRRAALPYIFTDDQVRATRLYTRLRKRLGEVGVNGHAVGARALLSEVQSALPSEMETIADIVRTYNDARFGGRALSKVQYEALLREVKRLKRHPSA